MYTTMYRLVVFLLPLGAVLLDEDWRSAGGEDESREGLLEPKSEGDGHHQRLGETRAVGPGNVGGHVSTEVNGWGYEMVQGTNKPFSYQRTTKSDSTRRLTTLAGITRPSTPSRDNRNWCPFVKSGPTTTGVFCGMQRFVERSLEPCRNGVADCQNVVYQLAFRPMYKMKQMLVTYLEWRCCLGFTGYNCEQKVPAEMTTSTSAKHTNKNIEMAAEVLNPEESSKILDKVQDQESWLHHLQDDISDPTASIQDFQKMTDRNGNITELSELQNVLKPHVENFLRQHFHSLWESFNKSLQDLSAVVHNLSQGMEVNRKSIDELWKQRESQGEMEDYNQKLQSKVKENSEKLKKLEAILSDQQEEMDAQQTAIHINLTKIKSGIDRNTQLLSNVMGTVERQEAQLTELNRSLANVYELNVLKRCPSCSSEEVSSDNAVSKHNFDELSRMVEVHSRNLTYLNGMCGLSSRQMVDMQQQVRTLDARCMKMVDGLRRKVNQKLNETRVGLTKNLLGLNTSFAHQSSINEDLLQSLENKIKDLSHQLHRSVTVTDNLRNTSNLLDKMQSDLDGIKWQELDLRNNMNDSVQDLYVALQQIRQQMQDLHLLQEEAIRAVVQDIAMLNNHSTIFGREISHLRKREAILDKHVKYLNSSFNSLLEDTFRHMVILESLVGEDILEVTADDAPEFLKLSINDVYEILNETEDRLSVHKMMLQTIDERLKLLEARRSTGEISESIQSDEQEHSVKDNSSGLDVREHMEPNHQALEEDKMDHLNKYEFSILTIKKDFEMLSLKVNKLESRCGNDEGCCNCSLEDGKELFAESVENLKSDVSSLKHTLAVFQNLPGFMETLSNGTFSNGRSGFGSKKLRKFQKQLQEQSQQRSKHMQMHGSPSVAPDNRNHSFAQESSSAFFVGLSNSSETNGILKFDQIFLNYGNGYSPKDGQFRASQAGVYMFAFAPGPGLLSLMVDGSHTVAVQNSRRKHHSINSTGGYVILQLHKGQQVWLEVKEGAAVRRNPPETTFGGFLLFKTF